MITQRQWNPVVFLETNGKLHNLQCSVRDRMRRINNCTNISFSGLTGYLILQLTTTICACLWSRSPVHEQSWCQAVNKHSKQKKLSLSQRAPNTSAILHNTQYQQMWLTSPFLQCLGVCVLPGGGILTAPCKGHCQEALQAEPNTTHFTISFKSQVRPHHW